MTDPTSGRTVRTMFDQCGFVVQEGEKPDEDSTCKECGQDTFAQELNFCPCMDDVDVRSGMTDWEEIV